MRTHYKAIARVEKPHGKRGEVVTVPVHGLPPMLREGLEIAIVPPPLKESRWHTVISVTGDERQGSLVRLSGCKNIGDAQAICGCTILARVDDLPSDYLLHDVDALMGRTVCDEDHGTLGTIVEVMVGPAQDVWVIDGEYGELMVPVVDAFVKDVPNSGPVIVELPQGSMMQEGE